MVLAGRPSLSDQLRGVVWEWLIHWPWSLATGEDGLSGGDTFNHGQEYEAALKKMTLKISVFDSNGEYDTYCVFNNGNTEISLFRVEFHSLRNIIVTC